MKKILAILCGATMMFAACTPDTGESLPYPTFPESSEYEITSGTGKYLKFAAEADWTLEVDYQYAYVKDNMGNMLSKVSGKAGEKNEVFVGAYSSIENYDADVVFHVLMKMNGYTQTLATFTIKKIEYAVQEYDIVSGNLRLLKFRATQPWTVTLSEGAKDYAYLKMGDEENDELSGTADGKEVTIRVMTYEDIKNYDADIVFSVYRKMGNAEAQEWAKFTIKKIEKPASIVAEESIASTISFEKYTGWSEYQNSANEVYRVVYTNEWDPKDGAVLINNVEGCEKITVYAYNANGTLTNFTSQAVPTFDSEGEEIEREPFWLNLWTTVYDKVKKFNLYMDLSHESAEWSWNPNENIYKAYVNFEDANGNVLTSVYYNCTYKPGQAVGGASKMAFINPNMAAQAGMTLTGSGNRYTLTFANPMSFDPMYASMCGFQIDGGGAQANFQDGGWGALNVVKYEDAELGNYFHICPLDMSTFNPYNLTVRNYTIDAFSNNWDAYTINVVLDWVVEADASALVKLCMPEMAPQCGVSLTGSGTEYVYTFSGYSALFDAATYSPYCGLVIANATSVTMAGGDIFTIKEGVNYTDEKYYYVTLVNAEAFDPAALTQTAFPITAHLEDGTTVTVMFTLAIGGNGGVGGGPLRK